VGRQTRGLTSEAPAGGAGGLVAPYVTVNDLTASRVSSEESLDCRLKNTATDLELYRQRALCVGRATAYFWRMALEPEMGCGSTNDKGPGDCRGRPVMAGHQGGQGFGSTAYRRTLHTGLALVQHWSMPETPHLTSPLHSIIPNTNVAFTSCIHAFGTILRRPSGIRP
jgi:hypothetical protein